MLSTYQITERAGTFVVCAVPTSGWRVNGAATEPIGLDWDAAVEVAQFGDATAALEFVATADGVLADTELAPWPVDIEL
ncbi:MAG: hypothetical protein AB9M53_00695 [Leptothrix sp. (in: b-proteobacteria)]